MPRVSGGDLGCHQGQAPELAGGSQPRGSCAFPGDGSQSQMPYGFDHGLCRRLAGLEGGRPQVLGYREQAHGDQDRSQQRGG
jgi:hypothetical protein